MNSIRFVFHGLASDATDAAAKGINALAAAYQLSTAAEREKALWPKTQCSITFSSKAARYPPSFPSAPCSGSSFTRAIVAVHTLRGRLHELAEETAQKNEDARRDADLIVDPSLAHQQEHRRTVEGEPRFFEGTLPPVYTDERVLISDDTAEASWITPRGGVRVACFPLEVPSHTWQWTASASSSFAHKGMMRAARTLTKTALELMTNKNALEVARREFDAVRGDVIYESPLHAELGPCDHLKPPPR